MRAHTRGAPTVFFISLLWPLLTVAAEEVDPSGGIPFMGGNYEGHPMLYFGRAEVEQLQYAAAGTHRHMARRIREAGESILERPEAYLPPWSSAEYTARWNEVYGNNLGLLSMFCLLYPHRAGALDLAKDYMERMAAQPSWYISTVLLFLFSFLLLFFFSFFCFFFSSFLLFFIVYLEKLPKIWLRGLIRSIHVEVSLTNVIETHFHSRQDIWGLSSRPLGMPHYRWKVWK